MKSQSMTIQMKAIEIEQYFPLALFVMLYKVVLFFECVDEIPKCDHSSDLLHGLVLSCGTHTKLLYNVVLTFNSMHEILNCDRSNESY